MCCPHTAQVAAKLQYYVYRLIDPRNGETFYVGKGKGNRVFSHAQGEIEGDAESEKLPRIRAIKLASLEVSHVIHRHGLTEEVAFEVEAALIDAYPGLSNSVAGHGSNEFGAAHSSEITRRYRAQVANFQHRVLLISVNRSALESSLYEGTRYAWRLSKEKAETAEFVLATVQGLIVAAFAPTKWIETTSENFPGRESIPGKYGFEGTTAPQSICDMYVGKRVPYEYRKRGASNPIKYSW